MECASYASTSYGVSNGGRGSTAASGSLGSPTVPCARSSNCDKVNAEATNASSNSRDSRSQASIALESSGTTLGSKAIARAGTRSWAVSAPSTRTRCTSPLAVGTSFTPGSPPTGSRMARHAPCARVKFALSSARWMWCGVVWRGVVIGRKNIRAL